MIQAKELRIGNWMKHSGGQFVQVTDIQFNPTHDGINSQSSVHFDPIPLTPQLLEKTGFAHRLGDYPGWYIGVDNGWWMRIWYGPAGFKYSINDVKSIDVNHLHQLQNLYFALTGKEIVVQL